MYYLKPYLFYWNSMDGEKTRAVEIKVKLSRQFGLLLLQCNYT